MDENSVRFYACGPTVYGPAHIGNFRTFVMQDVFRRVLETSGQKTFHVRNLTDVDDKTIRQSQEEGVKLDDFTDKWNSHIKSILTKNLASGQTNSEQRFSMGKYQKNCEKNLAFIKNQIDKSLSMPIKLPQLNINLSRVLYAL